MTTEKAILMTAAVLGIAVAVRELSRSDTASAPSLFDRIWNPQPGEAPASNPISRTGDEIVRAATGDQRATLGTWLFDTFDPRSNGSIWANLMDLRQQ